MYYVENAISLYRKSRFCIYTGLYGKCTRYDVGVYLVWFGL